MRVSVIIGTRDRSHLLRDALNGALEQDHPDLEIIVVDDGSSEEHAKAIADLLNESSRAVRLITLPRTSVGSGPSNVRNTGIKAATGRLLAFCDDDDYWIDPTYLSHAVRAFELNSELDLLFGNQVAKTNEKIAYDIWQPAFVQRIVKKSKDGETIEVTASDCLCYTGRFAHLNTLVSRKTLVEHIGLFSEFLPYCGDMDFYVRAVDKARRIAYLPRNVSIHRIPIQGTNANASTRVENDDKQLILIQVGHRLLQYCSTSTAQAYGKDLIGTAARRLAKRKAAEGHNSQALYWAHLAWLGRRSLKWAIYTALLRLKVFVGR